MCEWITWFILYLLEDQSVTLFCFLIYPNWDHLKLNRTYLNHTSFFSLFLFHHTALFLNVNKFATLGHHFICKILRAFSDSDHKFWWFPLFCKWTQVIVAQAAVQRCNATVDFLKERQPFFPVTVNSNDLHEHFEKVAGELLGSSNILDRVPLMGSEDFAFFTDAVPQTYYYFVGMQNHSHATLAPAHSPYFQINEEALPYGAALHASLAFQYLSESHTSPVGEKKFHDEL